jgi:death on curing protein
MTEPKWLSVEIAIAIHEAQLIEHGGPSGIRDQGLLESALERPRNKWAYEGADIPALAAAYGYGIAKNHPFIDGNKRTALMAVFTFLGLNDIDFDVPEADFAAIILGLAAGEIDEDGLDRWVADNLPKAL